MSCEAGKRGAEPYTKIVEELPHMRREAVQLVRQAVSEGRRAYQCGPQLPQAHAQAGYEAGSCDAQCGVLADGSEAQERTEPSVGA